MRGPEALVTVLDQLEGSEIAAGAWESEPAGPEHVAMTRLAVDEQCLAGRYVWARTSASRRADPRHGARVRATPIALLAVATINSGPPRPSNPAPSRAQRRGRAVAAVLGSHGASFFDELADATRLLPVQLEEALAELVALGLANSDSFAGLRALLLPADRRRGVIARGRRRVSLFGMADSGRWSGCVAWPPRAANRSSSMWRARC